MFNSTQSYIKPIPNLNNLIDLAITAQSYPISMISKDQLQLIEKYILKNIDCIGLRNNISPKFYDVTLKEGVVHIYCMNLETANWLCPIIQDVSIWPNEQLQICVANDLPKYTKIKFRFYGYNGNPNEIIKQLEIQNEGLLTKLWKISSVENTAIEQKQFLWVDIQSFDYLKYCAHTLNVNNATVQLAWEEYMNNSEIVIVDNDHNSYKKNYDKDLINRESFGVHSKIFH